MRADKMKSYSKNQSFLSQQSLELEEAKQMNIHVNNDNYYNYSIVNKNTLLLLLLRQKMKIF